MVEAVSGFGRWRVFWRATGHALHRWNDRSSESDLKRESSHRTKRKYCELVRRLAPDCVVVPERAQLVGALFRGGRRLHRLLATPGAPLEFGNAAPRSQQCFFRRIRMHFVLIEEWPLLFRESGAILERRQPLQAALRSAGRVRRVRAGERAGDARDTVETSVGFLRMVETFAFGRTHDGSCRFECVSCATSEHCPTSRSDRAASARDGRVTLSLSLSLGGF